MFFRQHHHFSRLAIGFALLIAGLPLGSTRLAAADEPSGTYYDYTLTGKPERPWLLPYHQTLVTKVFLCSRDGGGNVDTVHLTFAQALETIQRLDHITAGIPKVVYLVGWQHNGHDSKWPDWSVVNPALKRPEDATALDSLRWLIREGRKYNTCVSLHINMFDAFEDSPLWQSYMDQNIIAKDAQGNVIFGETHSGMRSSQISYTREWELGLAQKRIDDLIQMVPELVTGATIHIDAFHSMRPLGQNQPISPLLGHSVATEAATQRKIYRYWRNKGIDVTSEGAGFLRPDAFVGLQPMAWANEPVVQNLPDELYASTPMRAEPEIKQNPVALPGLTGQFCQAVMPWYHFNALGANPAAAVNSEGNTFLPALWKPELTLVAYSSNGYTNRLWPLPGTWKGITRVKSLRMTPDGLLDPLEIDVTDGRITLSLTAGEARLITAIGAPVPGGAELQNSSFESPDTPLYTVPTGWTVEAGSAFTHPAAGGLTPSEGVQAVALGNTPGTDLLSQEIAPLEPSTIYRVTFRIGWRSADPASPDTLRQGGVRIYLGNTLLTEKLKTFSTAAGDALGRFDAVETTFTTPNTSNPNLGLRVVLVGDAAGGIQTWFDQVQIERIKRFSINHLQINDTSCMLRWNSEPGRNYRIEYSSDLIAWHPQPPDVPSSGLTTEVSFPLPDGGSGFFRVMLL